VKKNMAVILGGCLWLASAGWPQSPAPQEKTGNANSPVRLDVVVTDKAGNSVAGLLQQDFTVLVDKQPRTLLSFHAFDDVSKTADVPVQVIFLIDIVNTPHRGVSNARQQLEKFLRDRSTLPVPMSLVFFTDETTQMQGAPTRKGDALADTLNSAESRLRNFDRSSGFFANVERIQRSLRSLENLAAYEAKQPGRKLLIWLGSGWPMMFGPTSAPSPKDQATIFRTVVKLSTQLREARVTVYSIDPLGIDDAGAFQTFYYENYLKGVPSASKVESGDVALQVIATQTGGRVLNRNNEVAKLIATCVADATTYYTLSINSEAADHPDEYHDIEVNIDKPGVTARTRNGYYAQQLGATK